MVFQIVSGILLLIFYLIYFMKFIILRRQNVNVNRLGKQDGKTQRTIIVERLVKYGSIVMVAIQIFSIIINEKWYYINVHISIKIIGLVLILFSDVIFLIAVMTMKNNWRVGITTDDTKLVTNGIYRFSRNPAFLAFDLSYIGLTLIFSNPINIIATILIIWFFDFQIREEEQYLNEKFFEYADYKKKVRRYL